MHIYMEHRKHYPPKAHYLPKAPSGITFPSARSASKASTVVLVLDDIDWVLPSHMANRQMPGCGPPKAMCMGSNRGVGAVSEWANG